MLASEASQLARLVRHLCAVGHGHVFFVRAVARRPEEEAMDGTMFDQWTRLLASAVSRRAVVGGLGAATAAAPLGGRGIEEAGAAALCIRDGKDCDPRRGARCCSGICRKRRKARGHLCAHNLAARGCTVNAVSCTTDSPLCPGDSSGVCIVLDNGQPVCTRNRGCSACETGADCDAAFDSVGGICVTRCPDCAETGGRACVFPIAGV